MGQFIRFVVHNNDNEHGMIICPCIKYGVVKRVDPYSCESHFVMYGIDQLYLLDKTLFEADHKGSLRGRRALYRCLFIRYIEFTLLSIVLNLYNLKAKNGLMTHVSHNCMHC